MRALWLVLVVGGRRSYARYMAKETVVETMVRGDAQDYGDLIAILLPGESRCAAYKRCVRLALQSPTILLYYRRPPLFPDWLHQGPMSPLDAAQRADRLTAQRFEVRIEEVPAEGRPPPAWPVEEEEEEADEA